MKEWMELDDTIKTTCITHEQLKYHTVFRDLYHDCVNIVQDTKPDDHDLLNAILHTLQPFVFENIRCNGCLARTIRSSNNDKNGAMLCSTHISKRQLPV